MNPKSALRNSRFGGFWGREELQILGLVALGNSNPEIAAKLHLAPGTVRNYVSTILTKLGVSDRTQAAVVAVRRGLVAKGDG